MNNERQKKTPLLTALKKYMDKAPVPFDVPGHKMGRVQNDLSDILGVDLFRMDVNAPIGIDNLYKGTGVIKKSEDLMAEAFNADKAIFLINGTTSGIMMMVMGCVNSGEKIILPRNVHKSAINSLIVSGAIPVFVEPDYDHTLGIANAVPVEEYVRAMDENPDAVAIFVINPTYFGVASHLEKIVEEAHKRDMIVMVDEAHGAHLHFDKHLPISAMDAGADISSLSMHKTCGSLTQSSALLIKGTRVDYKRVRKAYTMFGSTSPSHILLASLDASRKKLALEGKKIMKHIRLLSAYAVKELNKISGIEVLDTSYCSAKTPGRYAFDDTRLTIRVDKLKKSGFQVYQEMQKKYNIQLELAEPNLVLAILAIGSTKEDVDALIDAFRDMSSKVNQKGERHRLPKNLVYDYADIAISPRDAYYSDYETKKVTEEIEGRISCESVMIYPPGIPMLIPGEKITKNLIKIYEYYLKAGCAIMSDSPVGYIKVVKETEEKKIVKPRFFY